MDHSTLALHTVSLGTVIATLAGFLPPIAAALSIVWCGICIYESKTFKTLLKRFSR